MNKTNQKYWQRTLFYGRLFQLVPFLRCFILNGSLAQGRAKKSSDIDILIIAKAGRVFTTRFFVLVLAIILRIKRSKNESKSHAGKFCFNYFLTDDFLIIPHNRYEEMNCYCAENYSRSILVWGDQEIFKRFMEENEKWWGKYLISKSKFPSQNFQVKNIFLFQMMAKFAELMLGGWLGNKLEQCLKRWQISSIEKDPRTKQNPELIVYNDRELRFHPPVDKRKAIS